jgi:hypothetical protein
MGGARVGVLREATDSREFPLITATSACEKQFLGSLKSLFVGQARGRRKIDDIVLVNIGGGHPMVSGGIQTQLLREDAGRGALDGLT